MTARFAVVLAVIAGLVLAGTAIGLARRRHRRVSFDECLAMGFVFLGVIFVGSAIGVAFFGFDHWDLLSLIYVPVVVGLPIAGALLVGSQIVSRWWHQLPTLTKPALAVVIVMLIAAPFGFYATHIGPYQLEFRQVDVALLPAESSGGPVTLGVISDIQTEHVTDYERSAVRRLVDAHPDVILVAGDVWQGTDAGFERELPDLRAMFETMQAPGGAYLVMGDVDTSEELRRMTEGTPIEVLDAEIAETRIGGIDLAIGGVGLEPRPEDRTMLDDLQAMDDVDLRIVLGHRPDWAYWMPAEANIDLIVAGHTHGGQIQLPGIGALANVNQYTSRKAAAGGLHDLNGNLTYITTGVGHEQQGAPQIRFLDPPTIALLTVT